MTTTTHAQGKEWNAVFFSIVVNLGKTRIPSGEQVPIAFVADDNNIYISFSRQRVARCIVGGLQTFAQMSFDKHSACVPWIRFFKHIKELHDKDNIVSAAEWSYVMNNNGRQPLEGFAARYFSSLIVKADTNVAGSKGTYSQTS